MVMSHIHINFVASFFLHTFYCLCFVVTFWDHSIFNHYPFFMFHMLTLFTPHYLRTATLKVRNFTVNLSAKMASLTVRQGINVESKLPDSQVLIIGRKSVLQQGFDSAAQNNVLSAKLAPVVSQELFQQAKNRLLVGPGCGSVPLYLDLAKAVAVPDDVSRHNTPSNSYAFFKEVKSTKVVKGVKHLSIVLYTDYANAMASVAAVARAFPLFSEKSKQENSLESVELELVLVPEAGAKLADKDLAFLQSMVDNVRTSARLVDTPTNTLHSEKFLEEALAMVDGLGVPIGKTIIKDKELQKKGFGGIYSVGQAAVHPPIFACFSHTPKGAKETFALVGKGIVYDTGGLSLKGKTSMPTMKIDMGGAAGVLGAFCTLVSSGFAQNLHCLLCIAENQISPTATRPDDIIKMLSGKTVEVNNTDAEGRLVLADGVFYANDTLKADTIIDMATLTGAQLYASGKYHASILCNSEQLEGECIKAGQKSGDLVHPLPFAPEMHFMENMSSKLADMKNARLDGNASGPPTAIAGLFIGTHIDYGLGKPVVSAETTALEGTAAKPANWLHIDMAGLALSDGRATGYGVGLICSLLAKHIDVGVAKFGEGK